MGLLAVLCWWSHITNTYSHSLNYWNVSHVTTFFVVFLLYCACLSTVIVHCKCSEKLEQRPDVQQSASVQSHHSLTLPGKQLATCLLRFFNFSCLQSAYRSSHSTEILPLLVSELHIVWCSKKTAIIRLVVFLWNWMSNLAVFILQLLSGLLHLFHTYITELIWCSRVTSCWWHSVTMLSRQPHDHTDATQLLVSMDTSSDVSDTGLALQRLPLHFAALW